MLLEVTALLRERFGIAHVTLQPEAPHDQTDPVPFNNLVRRLNEQPYSPSPGGVGWLPILIWTSLRPQSGPPPAH